MQGRQILPPQLNEVMTGGGMSTCSCNCTYVTTLSDKACPLSPGPTLESLQPTCGAASASRRRCTNPQQAKPLPPPELLRMKMHEEGHRLL